jgi:MYXO-CTERM domain-containing protein
VQRFALPVLVALSSCAPAPPLASHEAPIINGVYDAEHEAVVLLTWLSHRCTGTAISPWIVLTAAHCIDGGFGTPTVPTQVYFGSDPAQGGKTVAAASAHFHPKYDPYSISNDIGLVVLDQPSPYEPIPLSFADVSGAAGTPMTIVGFGRQSTTAGSPANQKLKVTVDVDLVTSQVLQYRASVCSGDSGGPGIFVIDGKEHVVSVTSYGDLCRTYGASQRVDIHRRWLEEKLAAHDRTTCVRDFRCATGCAEADPDCPCSPTDGFCSALCADPESDPDCPRGCGGGDVCVKGPACPAPDPDCGDPCGAEGHCVHACPTRDPDCAVPLADGMTCDGDIECTEGSLCVGTPGHRTCARRCDPASPSACPSGRCVPLAAGVAVCEAALDDDGGGCAVGRRGGPRGGAWGAALLALLLAWRRRRAG